MPGAAGVIAGAHLFPPETVAGMYGWWDTSNTLSITDAGSGHCSQLVTQGGSAGYNPLSQGTDANRPITGTRSKNSLNVLDFDGTAHRMTTANSTLAQPWTMFLVCLSDDGADGTAQTAISASVSGVNFGKLAANSWSLNCGTALSGGTADTSASYFTLIANGASSSIRRNAAAVASGNAGSNSWSNEAIRPGCKSGTVGNFWDGWIGEIILYNSALSSTNYGTIETYLAAKWAI